LLQTNIGEDDSKFQSFLPSPHRRRSMDQSEARSAADKIVRARANVAPAPAGRYYIDRIGRMLRTR
jgi:hypothetical protein